MGVGGRRFDRCSDAKIVGPGGAGNDGGGEIGPPWPLF